jgi:hypothetical protein
MFVDKRSFSYFFWFWIAFLFRDNFIFLRRLTISNCDIMDKISPEDYDKMEELFFNLIEKGRSHICRYGEAPFYYVVVNKEEIPENHPLNKYLGRRPVFGTYIERKHTKDPPVLFVNNDNLPDEFKEIPRRFHDMNAFLAFRHAATENYEQAIFDTLREMQKDPKKIEEWKYLQNHYCRSI